MKKQKGRKKTDDITVFEATYLTAINRNVELIKENKALTDELEQFKSTGFVLTSKPNKGKYLIQLKMYRDKQEKVFNFTDIVQLIQFESPALLVKLLRQIHHNYSVLNIDEMTKALNNYKPTVSKYSEGIPNELYILKTLADCIEEVKEVPVNS
jgi:hypothetical protein